MLRKPVVQTPALSPEDRARCVQLVWQMLGSSQERFKEIQQRVLRLCDEGVTLKMFGDALNERKHEKDEAKWLSDGPMNTTRLTFKDLDAVAAGFGIYEDTPANRQRWAARFSDGRARFLCPRCGYSGNGEFTTVGDELMCFKCRYMADARYFTQKWKPGEQEAFEAERQAKIAEDNRRYLEQAAVSAAKFAEQQRRQRAWEDFVAKHTADAVKATKAIDLFQFVKRTGEDPEDYFDGEVDKEKFDLVLDLMAHSTKSGPVIPWDEIVGYFKENLQGLDDDLRDFRFVATQMREMMDSVADTTLPTTIQMEER
jgi:hypothetical protein